LLRVSHYQTRLTADLLTGKLDVREAAAHLPRPACHCPRWTRPRRAAGRNRNRG
jgi:hypothetical protein